MRSYSKTPFAAFLPMQDLEIITEVSAAEHAAEAREWRKYARGAGPDDRIYAEATAARHESVIRRKGWVPLSLRAMRGRAA